MKDQIQSINKKFMNEIGNKRLFERPIIIYRTDRKCNINIMNFRIAHSILTTLYAVYAFMGKIIKTNKNIIVFYLSVYTLVKSEYYFFFSKFHHLFDSMCGWVYMVKLPLFRSRIFCIFSLKITLSFF